MSNQVRANIDTSEYDSDDNLTLDPPQYTILADYDNKDKQEFVIGSGTVYKTINFGKVANTTMVIMRSTQQLSITLNGGSQIFEDVEELVLKGKITGMTVKNNSGADATVTVELYGNDGCSLN